MTIWIAVKDAAPLLGMSEQGLYSAIRERQLPDKAVLRIGRRIRINSSVLSATTRDDGARPGVDAEALADCAISRG
jgi:predicted DNA-binding transcriptional regulator AlpA